MVAHHVCTQFNGTYHGHGGQLSKTENLRYHTIIDKNKFQTKQNKALHSKSVSASHASAYQHDHAGMLPQPRLFPDGVHGYQIALHENSMLWFVFTIVQKS